LFRHVLAIGAARGRALGAVLALATVPIGTQLALTAQLSVLVGLFVVMPIAEDCGVSSGGAPLADPG
jgi:hypothetical protein